MKKKKKKKKTKEHFYCDNKVATICSSSSHQC